MSHYLISGVHTSQFSTVLFLSAFAMFWKHSWLNETLHGCRHHIATRRESTGSCEYILDILLLSFVNALLFLLQRLTIPRSCPASFAEILHQCWETDPRVSTEVILLERCFWRVELVVDGHCCRAHPQSVVLSSASSEGFGNTFTWIAKATTSLHLSIYSINKKCKA